ncbi:hypothetical protein L6164_031266 [Bauhinia variegata]|uniref:Uncharacterized protein n=1 Tax=Bauhinia variegata TaxID=167791 RepID=A0ACB9LEG7_BAUVA|nr:hypothetical protein L6164_031266 [Bauhinia variegata]
MLFEPDAVMWSSLCKVHRNLTMAARICEHLHTSRPWNPSNYVLLANSYAFIGGWKETLETREVMDMRRVRKSVGCSWVEIGGCMHSFLSGDNILKLKGSVKS